MEPSYVLKAMGLSDELAYSSLRFSLGKYSTDEEIAFATGILKNTLKKLKSVKASS
jgi:cysteine desulfurase